MAETNTLREVFTDPTNIIFFTLIGLVLIYYLVQLFRLSLDVKKLGYKNCWNSYAKQIGREVLGKTTIPASEFFNIDTICESYNVSVKHFQAVSSTLVGLGILGTFVGLSIALIGSDISFVDQAAALGTITELYGGMRTAFWTSALGMGTSLIYGALYRYRINSLEKQIDDICTGLDGEYLVTPINLMTEQNRLLAEFGQNIYNGIVKQTEMLSENSRYLFSQLELQRQSIQERVANICNQLELQKQSMLELGGDLQKNLIDQNRLLEEMGTSIGSSVGQQLVQKLQDSMSSLINGVTESMHENMLDASQHLKQSAEMLDLSTENLTSATDKIDSVTKNLPETIDAMSNVIGDVQELLESVNDSTTELTTKHEAIVETLGNIGDSAIQLNEVIDTVNTSIANMNIVIKNINIPQILQAQKDQYTQVENLVTAQHEQISSLTGQQLDILNNIEDLRVCIEKLYESIGAVTNIKKDVKDIFEAINAGLQEHVNLLHNQTTGLLTTYTDKFTSATESINNTVGNLTESFDSAANTMFVSVSESAKKIEEATALIAKNK